MCMDQPRITIAWDAIDWDCVDESGLAMMLMALRDGLRTWKGIDWEVLNGLHKNGLITDPKLKAKSVLFTNEGLEESQRLFERLFGHSSA